MSNIGLKVNGRTHMVDVEPATPLLAAVANAIFDATGVCLRRVPFRDARVLAALKAVRV